MSGALVRGHDPHQRWFNGTCHCGAVRFRVALTGGLGAARRCDCSLCRRRGAVTLTARPEDFTVVAGAERLVLYRFGSGVAEHHFCGVCGIYTHHRRRSNPDELGINAACLGGLSPFDFAEVPVNDGINHPSDGHPRRIAGMLRYDPAD